MSDKKPQLMTVVVAITAVLGVFGGVLTFDSRYVKESSLESTKNEIIGEMRREVVRNRSVMINSMQREADDVEFQISELESKNKKAPRYLLEKHKQITRQIEDLKNDKE